MGLGCCILMVKGFHILRKIENQANHAVGNTQPKSDEIVQSTQL